MAAGRDIHLSPRLPVHNHFHHMKHKKPSKCFVHFITLIVILCVAALVFANIVFRAAGKPKLTVEAVRVSHLNYGITNNMAYLTLTAAAELRLHNGDFGRFRYRTGVVTAVYGNSTIGKASIKNGVVLGRKSARINVALEIKPEYNVMKDPSFVSQVASNSVEMQWFAELSGQVRAVRFMTTHKTSVMNCSLSLNLSNKVVQDILC